MITIDFTTSALEAHIDYCVNPIARIITGGTIDEDEYVRRGGRGIAYTIGNRSRMTGGPDFIVRERMILETGIYEVMSSYRRGFRRNFTLVFDLDDERLQVHLTAAKKNYLIFEDESLICEPGQSVILTVPLDRLSEVPVP